MTDRATKKRRDDCDTPFGAWLRHHPALRSCYGYDAENQDYWWHDYRAGYLMLLEEKRFNAPQSFAQRDTFSVVDQLLRFACSHPDCNVKREIENRPTKIRYFGSHLIQFERNSPEDGGIRIDGIPISAKAFLRFLQFDERVHGKLKSIQEKPKLEKLLEEIRSKLEAQRNIYEWEES